MSGYQQVTILGNVGRDPDMRSTAGGMSICNLSIATSEKRKGEERTEWHRCVLFDKTAEIAEKYVRKGGQVLVVGRLQTRKWEKDGVERYSTEILVDRLTLVGGKPDSKPAPQQASQQDSFDEDIPF